MKKILLTVLTLLVLTTFALPALALGPLDIDADVTVMSQYVWRGLVINPEAVLQPSLSAGILGIGFGFWGNVDLTDIYENNGQFNEFDWVASYGLPLPLVDLNFGLIYYDYPNTETNSTAEAFVTGSVGVLLSPTLEIYYDFKNIDGTYVNASISYPVALGETVNLDLGAALGFGSGAYTKGYFGTNSQSGTTDFNLSASVPFKPIPFFTITPSATYSTLMSNAKDFTAENGGDTDAMFYGISVSFSF